MMRLELGTYWFLDGKPNRFGHNGYVSLMESEAFEGKFHDHHDSRMW